MPSWYVFLLSILYLVLSTRYLHCVRVYREPSARYYLQGTLCYMVSSSLYPFYVPFFIVFSEQYFLQGTLHCIICKVPFAIGYTVLFGLFMCLSSQYSLNYTFCKVPSLYYNLQGAFCTTLSKLSTGYPLLQGIFFMLLKTLYSLYALYFI